MSTQMSTARDNAPRFSSDKTQLGCAERMLAVLEEHDLLTGQHSHDTVVLVDKVSCYLGLTEAERVEARLVAMLHDVGKVAMPKRLLEKPGPLDQSETGVMQAHAAIGANTVEKVQPLTHLAPAIRASHERWDGMGYPDGLQAEQIPLASRITFVCDAYDAMTSNRPYRQALSSEAAQSELRRCAGKQFCPTGVNALLSVLTNERTASLSSAAA